MKFESTLKFEKNLQNFPRKIQDKFKVKLNYLLQNIRHPSLHAKKYDEAKNIWQARLDRNIRFYFLVEKNKYILLDIKEHP